MPQAFVECPAPGCEGGSADKQHLLTDSQLDDLPVEGQDKVLSSREMVYRCEHCGCVYSGANPSARVIGFLTYPESGPAWIGGSNRR